MALKPTPCLVRVATAKRSLDVRVATVEDVILFFPFDLAQREFIASWTSNGAHKDVPAASVALSRAPLTPDEVAAGAEALAIYAARHADFPVYPVRRLPVSWEAKAWKGQA